MDVDILVVGLGTAGSAVARSCARAGLRVRGVDAAPLDRTGARWVNGVPFWAFEHAGLERPTFPELRAAGSAFHIVAGWGPERVVVDAAAFAEVDMRHFQARLRAEAEAAGARLDGNCRVHVVEFEGPRARVEMDGEEVHARVVIDASGMTGAGIAPREPVGPSEICVAAQQIREIQDVPAARAWFREQGVIPGETLCFTGVAGGFSVVNVRLEEELDEPGLAILTGSIPGLGHESGVQLLERFVAEHPWVGERILGGARPIPLETPVPRLDHGRILRIGDAARQVYSAHGSGIAAQLVAARLYAERLVAGDTPWQVNVAWQRRCGGELAAATAFARFSRDLGTARLAQVMCSGLMPSSASLQSLLQRPMRPSVVDLPRMAVGAILNPAIVREMVPILNRMTSIRRLAKKYPDDPTDLTAWIHRREKLLDGGR